MPYRGWLSLNGQEINNTSRLLAHMVPAVPTEDGEAVSAMQCACDLNMVYDDSWTGLREAVGDDPYVITNAPWYNAARPESSEFAGIWMLEVTGFDSAPVQREIAESICAGGVASRARDATRVLTFSALVVACTNAGAEYGKDWLGCVLRQSNVRGGVDLNFYKAHPEDTAADPEDLFRTAYGVVMTQSPTVVDQMGKGGSARHRQSSVYRVEWEMVATRPAFYGRSDVFPVDWDSVESESITWAHAPDCSDTSSCGLPTIFNAECTPPTVNIAATVIPTCGGCVPLCELERRTWEMPTQLGACEDSVINIRVTNMQVGDPLTVNMFWRPCGSTDICDQVHPLQVAGLDPGYVAVADSVTGRPYIEIEGITHRQVGIISTPNGAPWRPTSLDSGLCWELVAESAPGADYDVIIEVRERDA